MQRSHNKRLVNPHIKCRYWDYHNPSTGVSMFYSYQYTCDLVNWKLSPVASFSILLRMTIHYNYSIMSLKWVLFSSLHTSGKAFQLTVTCMTSTSLHSVDGEADCKLDSALYLVPYLFTH